MGKRKGRLEPSKTQNTAAAEEEVEHENENGIAEGRGFFACYLLVSLNPRFKGHTYIGFTVNPRRRIRQHNGEIRCGAWRTKWKRPWEMVLCIYGFPTNVAALQFEWAWQHPVESLAVRKAAASFKSLSGVANKIKLAYTMLTLPSWQSMNITVNFFSTQYMKHCAGCPSLPEHMKVQIGSMDELPCYTETVDGLSENDDDCFDEKEHQNNSSNNTSVSVGSFDSMVCDSAENSSQIDNNNEAFRWTNREYEVRKPCNSVTSQDQIGLFGSINLLTRKSSEVFNDSDKAREIMEEDRDIISANMSGDELCQPAHKQSSINSSVDINEEHSSKFIVPPPEAEIIDLCTPSPNCRSFAESKKRRIRCDFIDLTMSPNFVQL